MMLDAAILIATLITGAVLWLPSLTKRPAWRAMTTPLASIIGSGFLLLGPILATAYGAWAPAAMAALCALAWAFGWAVRRNIRTIDEDGDERPPAERRLEQVASLALGFAYMISVAYYLNLFGAFALSLTPWTGRWPAQVLTSAMFGVILAVGMLHGFRMLERMEYISVSLKLAIIAGLLVGLSAHFGGKASGGALVFLPVKETGWAAVTLFFGLIVTVQGFETSRYLGETYDAKTRIRSMRWAQLLSTAVYLAYIGLVAYLFRADELELKETAIVDMMQVVAPVLPLMLVAAALAAQFSAAVADTGGSGGLISELSAGRIGERLAYLVLGVVGLFLTWTLDVFHIVAYASRAFAMYYGLQAALAALAARRKGDGALPQAALWALALTGAAITVFGQPAEG